MNLKHKVLPLVLAMSPFLANTAQAEVIKQFTSINAGYWWELNSDSKRSNQHDESVIVVDHRTIADWGSVRAAGRLENVGATEDELDGSDGQIGFKAFVSAYYNVGQNSGFQLWYDLFVVSNKSIAENHNYLGVAYKNNLGKLNYKFGAAIDYVFGHAGSSKNCYDGFGEFAAKVNLSYPIMDQLTAIGMFEYQFDRDSGLRNVYDWDSDGHHAVLGLNWKFTPKISTTLTWHDFSQWGGYNNDGQSLQLMFGYVF